LDSLLGINTRNTVTLSLFEKFSASQKANDLERHN
jgi:hypothetical protein